MLILLAKLKVKVDLILFADTGGELLETYDYLETFSDWLISEGMPPITVVNKAIGGVSDNRVVLKQAKRVFNFLIFSSNINLFAYCLWSLNLSNSQYATLEEQCLITQTLPSQAYGRKSCSVIWKIEPQDKFVKQWLIDNDKAGSQIIRCIGYHSGEQNRVFNKSTKQPMLEEGDYLYSYPLIENSIDEMRCRMLIASVGLKVPPKSSCFFCPNRSPKEVQSLPQELRDRGELIEQTNKLGVHHREGTSVKGLGRRFAWSDLGKMTELESLAIQNTLENKSCSCIDW